MTRLTTNSLIFIPGDIYFIVQCGIGVDLWLVGWGDETYIPRSLDVTELELIELIKESIREKVFSEGFIEMLKQEINQV